MLIIQDTREKTPLQFTHPYVSGVNITKLEVGDYGCQFTDGYIHPVFFERKSLGDLFGTFGKGYKRFKQEILRAKELNYTIVIIIEASFSQVLRGYERSIIEGISIVRKLFTLWIRYGIHFVCCRNSEEAAQYIAEFYCAAGKEHIKKNV